ncbi:FtsX-like permease family protein [Yinghuangia sp. YIM S09857]|uniref:ABC transporter permease n=1 Tax=Yinghuangia sp. YIM S09857 TaxID=3436929 RepID=UPI003F53AA9E
MNAVVKAAWAAVVRRRVQTVVTAVVALLATATSVLALGLLVASMAPFDHAFSSLHGAHAAVSVDAAQATAEQVEATAASAGIAEVGGPYPATSAPMTFPGDSFARGTLTVVGRTDPDGPVDRLKIRSGRWARAPGEVVLADGEGPRLRIGEKLRLGDVELTVVGTAASVTDTAGAWTVPEQIAALEPVGTAKTFQALYRFTDADDSTAVADGVSSVRAALPSGAVLGSTSYLDARRESAGTAALVVPFVTAFSVLGVVMSVLIVGNVVSGAVVAGYRGIGVLKTLGFTPRQVSAAYLAQVLLPAVVGAVAGTLAGHALAVPLLADTERSYAVPEVPAIPWWVDLAVPAGLLLVVAVAALLPALRAGRIPAVQAIAVGRAPRTGRGFRAHRLLARSRLPRAVGLGLASPFARPARTGMTLAALLLGTTAVTFAYGLGQTLNRADDGLSREGSSQVTVALGMPGERGGMHEGPPGGPGGSSGGPGEPPGGPGEPPRGPGPMPEQMPTADPVAVAEALRADAGTARFTSVTTVEVEVPGRTRALELTGYDIDSSWLGYPVVAGRWFEGPGEVVVPTSFLRASALRVGDEIALDRDGRRVTVRIVGEVFANDEEALYTDRATLLGLKSDAAVTSYEVQVAPGTNAAAYAKRISAAGVFAAGHGAAVPRSESNETLAVLIGLIGTLTLLIAGVAGLGVLNTVALDTRERAQSIGVLKSLGMTPRQTMAMVVTSVVGLGLVGGAAGIPLGVALHHVVAPVMASTADLRLPDTMVEVYGVPAYAVLAVSGAVLAALGALLPAGWAARSRAAAWRTE